MKSLNKNRGYYVIPTKVGIHFPFFIIFIIPILFSCATPMKEITTLPSFKLVESTLSKRLNINDTTATPVDPAFIFSTGDSEVIAHLKFKNLTGEHKLRWDWIGPSGSVYYSTGNYTLKSSGGKYKEEVTAWHRLSIKGDRVSDSPGDWQVQVYLDGLPLVSKNFKIELDVDTLSGVISKPDPRNWGLIIGIEKYPNFPSVDYAEDDARLVREYFKTILGIPEENIISLLGSEATKARIRGYLKSYIPKNVAGDTNLFVYYSGHGLPYPGEGGIEPYLVPHDSDTRTITETGYRLKEFYQDIDNLNIRRAIVFLDACFSGVASRGEKMLIAGGRPIVIHVEENALLSGKVISMTSSSGGEISGSYPEKGHGLFTYFLLRGLRGEADADDNGSLVLEELYTYVKDNVNKVSRRQGIEQTPEISPSLNVVKDVEINTATSSPPFPKGD